LLPNPSWNMLAVSECPRSWGTSLARIPLPVATFATLRCKSCDTECDWNATRCDICGELIESSSPTSVCANMIPNRATSIRRNLNQSCRDCKASYSTDEVICPICGCISEISFAAIPEEPTRPLEWVRSTIRVRMPSGAPHARITCACRCATECMQRNLLCPLPASHPVHYPYRFPSVAIRRRDEDGAGTLAPHAYGRRQPPFPSCHLPPTPPPNPLRSRRCRRCYRRRDARRAEAGGLSEPRRKSQRCGRRSPPPPAGYPGPRTVVRQCCLDGGSDKYGAARCPQPPAARNPPGRR
jgi:hypothetical protein